MFEGKTAKWEEGIFRLANLYCNEDGDIYEIKICLVKNVVVVYKFEAP